MNFPTFSEIACPNPGCRNQIFRKSSDGNWRFRVRQLKIEKGGADVVAICKSCGAEVQLPILLVPRDDQPNLLSRSRSGFYVEKEKKP